MLILYFQYGPGGGMGRGGGGFRGGRGGGRGGFNQGPGRGPGGYEGGGFQDQTTFSVPADKCGLVIGKGRLLLQKRLRHPQMLHKCDFQLKLIEKHVCILKIEVKIQ